MSLSSRRIRDLIAKKEMNIDKLISIVEENHPKDIRKICNLNKNRFDEILDGDDLTFLESMLIVEALGYSISDMFM